MSLLYRFFLCEKSPSSPGVKETTWCPQGISEAALLPCSRATRSNAEHMAPHLAPPRVVFPRIFRVWNPPLLGPHPPNLFTTQQLESFFAAGSSLTRRTCFRPCDPARPQLCASLCEMVRPVFSSVLQDRATAVGPRGGIFQRGEKLATTDRNHKPPPRGQQTEIKENREGERKE